MESTITDNMGDLGVVVNGVKDKIVRKYITNISETAKLAEARPDEPTNIIGRAKANLEVSYITKIAKECDKRKTSRHESSSRIDSGKQSEQSLFISKPKEGDVKESVDESPESILKKSNNANTDSCNRSVDKTKRLTDDSLKYNETINAIVTVDDDDDDNDIVAAKCTINKAEDDTNNKNKNVEEANHSKEVCKNSLKRQKNGSGFKDDNIISSDIDNKASTITEDNNNDKNASQTKIASEPDTTESKDEKPLVALNFLRSFKTKITDMTRADLEEFCILKIVEGVADRSNLSDVKEKLKTLMQNGEEWKKKTMVLNKQNRDLQIVLRTVQEEQKKKTKDIITPLKITRSVGMQVLMTENKVDPSGVSVQKLPVTDVNTSAIPKSAPVKTPPPNKNVKAPIPIPQLVPTLNRTPSKPAITQSSQVQNSNITSNGIPPPNGVRTNKRKADKRPNSSVSIDLTDDESPPAKQIATGKGVQPPVRLVPSQQLMAPEPRSPLVRTKQNANSSQVRIPIKGDIRPGIVSKTNQSNVRARQPGTLPGTIVRGTSPYVRATAPSNRCKHPAPLPQASHQPQPPAWKALPPAPNLKITKIENDIVVSWKIDGYHESVSEEIVSYQLYAYQETAAPPSTHMWNKIGDIKALPLPMACTLTQFVAGYKYYFAVRAVDSRSRIGPFSLPGNILLHSK